MRRLLLAVLLAVGTVATPAPASAPRGGSATPATSPAAAPARVPGLVAVAPLTGVAWVGQQREAFAGTGDLARDTVGFGDRARAGKADDEDSSVYQAFAVDDLDGDRVPDLVFYRSDFTLYLTPFHIEGSTSLTLYSGRDGRRGWTRRFDAPLMSFGTAPVGKDRRTGVLFLDATWDGADHYALRYGALAGRTGKTVYDLTFDSGDGQGDIEFGGLFDAVIGGGVDALVGRVRMLLGIAGPHDLGVYEATPYVVDGRDGTVRQAHETVVEVGAGVSYVPTGDLDGDSRDDFLAVRRIIDDVGSVTAFTTVENGQLWYRDNLAVGAFVLTSGSANVTGDRHDDVLLTTYVVHPGLLEIPPYTDGLPLLDGPDEGVHGLLLDGATGVLRWDRRDAVRSGYYQLWDDVDGDHKAEVLGSAVTEGDKRDTLTVRLLTGANKVLWKRDVAVTTAIARRFAGGSAYAAGDLDGDRITDAAFYVYSGSPAEEHVAQGLLLVRGNRRVDTDDWALRGTVDGGTADRLRYRHGKSTESYTVLDGWHGRAYWSLMLPLRKDVGAGLSLRPGAHGRCDGFLLHGGTKDGAYWVDVLDGASGRVLWSKVFVGDRAPDTWPRVSGTPARCRP